jgi:molybdenum cofactor cytidylyltransferase
MPRLSVPIINRLIETHDRIASRMIAPLLAGKRGHPVLFPWALAARVFALQPDEGLNAIVETSDPLLIPCDDLVISGENPFADIDTPDDFTRLGEGQSQP